MVKQLLDDSNFGVDETGCGNCIRSFQTDEPDRVACGAAYEDDPIWAVRESSPRGILTMLENQKLPHPQYIGQDCESMRPDDGGSLCKAYIRRNTP